MIRKHVMHLLQKCVWVYMLITKQTSEWWQEAEPADSTCSHNLFTEKVVFSSGYEGTFQRLCSFMPVVKPKPRQWGLSLNVFTEAGDISELVVNQQRFGKANVPWCRLQFVLLVLDAIWMIMTAQAAVGESLSTAGKDLHSRGDPLGRTGMETLHRII